MLLKISFVSRRRSGYNIDMPVVWINTPENTMVGVRHDQLKPRWEKPAKSVLPSYITGQVWVSVLRNSSVSPYALGLIFVPSGNEAVLSGNRKALGSCNSCRWVGSGQAVSCCALWACALFLDDYFNDQCTERQVSVSWLTAVTRFLVLGFGSGITQDVSPRFLHRSQRRGCSCTTTHCKFVLVLVRIIRSKNLNDLLSAD